jgi:hypothetical protein
LCHHRGARKHFGRVQLKHSSVYAGSEAEVVRIHDKARHED